MSETTNTGARLPDAPLQATIEAALLSRGWRYKVRETPTGYRSELGLRSKAGHWRVVIDLRNPGPVVVVRTRPDLIVAAERRPEVAQFLARVNEAIVMGSWQIDLETGNVEVRTWLDGSSLDAISAEAIESLVDEAMGLGIDTRPALEGVAFRELDAATAFGTTPLGSP